MFVYQLLFNTLDFKKGTDYIIYWKSIGLFESKRLQLYGAFLPDIKYFGMQFNKTLLVVGQESYATKTVKVNIVYDLDNLLKIPLLNFTLKNCPLGVTNSKN